MFENTSHHASPNDGFVPQMLSALQCTGAPHPSPSDAVDGGGAASAVPAIAAASPDCEARSISFAWNAGALYAYATLAHESRAPTRTVAGVKLRAGLTGRIGYLAGFPGLAPRADRAGPAGRNRRGRGGDDDCVRCPGIVVLGMVVTRRKAIDCCVATPAAL
jgi:hypothetical protein